MGSAAPLIPPRPSLRSLRAAAAGCRACPLWERGTQTVFGEGERRATVMLVGEQPGNDEDLAGRPFVGPAGVHSSSILRAPDDETRRAEMKRFVADLKKVAALLRRTRAA
jgi:DNA polymerase